MNLTGEFADRSMCRDDQIQGFQKQRADQKNSMQRGRGVWDFILINQSVVARSGRLRPPAEPVPPVLYATDA